MESSFNWGWRIASFYIAFVAFMLFMVFKTTTVKDDLVAKDYYALELKFQEQIDKQNRANQLSEPVQWEVKQNEISIAFPKEVRGSDVKAKVVFYNPSDAKKDVSIEAVSDKDGVVALDKSQLQNGVYQMKIDWTAGGVNYYNEGTVRVGR